MRYALAIVLLLACSGCARYPEPGTLVTPTAIPVPPGSVQSGPDNTGIIWGDLAGLVHSEEVKPKPIEKTVEKLCPPGVVEGTQNGFAFVCNKGKAEFGSTGPLVQHNDNVPLGNDSFGFSGSNIITDQLFISVEPQASVLINWEGGGLEPGASNAYPIYSVEIKDSTGKELLSCGWDAETKHVKDCKLENDASLESAMDAMVQAFKGTYEGKRK